MLSLSLVELEAGSVEGPTQLFLPVMNLVETIFSIKEDAASVAWSH